MTIIDLTEEKQQEVEKKKIELVSCLQSNPHEKTQDNYFYRIGGEYTLRFIGKKVIKRVSRNASDTGMDLIIISSERGDEIWLGFWNDGVI